jgi:hypothetical protein
MTASTLSPQAVPLVASALSFELHALSFEPPATT